MELIKQSTRLFTFHIDDPLYFTDDGVQAKGYVLNFLKEHKDNIGKKTFRDEQECIEWYNKGNFKMDKQVKNLEYSFTTECKSISDTEWGLIEKLLPKGSTKTKDDFRIFTDYLANNIVDREKDRFSKKVLNKFAQTIVGKQKLLSHRWPEHGIGKYFKATVKKFDIEQVLEMFDGKHPDPKIEELLKKIEEMDKGLLWLVAQYFMSTRKLTIIDDIESGIPNSSIGFMPMPRVEIKDEDGNFLWYEFELTPESEALEGSLVGVPAQFGAGAKSYNESENTKKTPAVSGGEIETDSLSDDCFAVIEPTGLKDKEGKTLPLNARHVPHHLGKEFDGEMVINALKKIDELIPVTDRITEKKLRESARLHLLAHLKSYDKPEKTGGKSMKFLLKSIGFDQEAELEEEPLKTLFASIDTAFEAKLKEATENSDALSEQLKNIESLYENKGEKSVFELIAEDFELAKYGRHAIGKLVDETVKYKVLLTLVESDEAKIKAEKDLLGTLTPEQIEAQYEQFKKKYDDEHPLLSQTKTNNDDKLNPDNKQTERRTTPASRFVMD